jgi:NAD(P)H-dependent FMN reductase
MSRILGISGSLRNGSYNSALLRAAKELFPETIEIGNIRKIPMYNGDVEAAGVPEAVLALQQQLINSTGLLLVSPEYNNSMPGVLKNAVDWLSRPSPGISNVFRDKPVALIGASPGGFGTILAQNAWLPVIRSMGARHWSGGRLMVSGASRVFDDDGILADESIRQRLEQYVKGFMEFCEI